MKFAAFVFALMLGATTIAQADHYCNPCDVSWEIGKKGIYYATQKGRADKKNGKLSSAPNADGAVLHVHVATEPIECYIETDEGDVLVEYDEVDLSYEWYVWNLGDLQDFVDGIADEEDQEDAQEALDAILAECGEDEPDITVIGEALDVLEDLGLDPDAANLAVEKELDEDEEGPAAWYVPQENIEDGKNDYLIGVVITDNCIDDEEEAETILAACLEIRGLPVED